MSIVLVIPDRKLEKLQRQLQLQLPAVNIEIWPEVSAPEQVQFAVVWKQPAGSLQQFPQLKALQSFGAGVDNIMLDPQLPDLPLARIVDPKLTESMLQYLDTVVRQYQLRFDQFHSQQQARVWKPRSPRSIKQITVLGLGQLGAAAAQHFAAAGFEVNGWAQSEKQLAQVQCFAGETQFAPAVAQADLVICLLPLTNDTENYLSQQRLAAFKTGAILVNVARGAILDDLALLESLDSGQLAAACLDVFRQEPLPEQHPFWGHPQLMLTPHISAVTDAQTAVEQIADNYRRTMAGLPMLNLVDKTRGY